MDDLGCRVNGWINSLIKIAVWKEVLKWQWQNHSSEENTILWKQYWRNVILKKKKQFILLIFHWICFALKIKYSRPKFDSSRLRAKLYDRKDDFNFPMVNFHFHFYTAIFQQRLHTLMRYSWACGSYYEFLSEFPIAQSQYLMFCRSLFVVLSFLSIFLLAILLSVLLRCKASVYTFGTSTFLLSFHKRQSA